jgi:hypothetical protein
METNSQHEWGVRAARNQSLFRAINEKLEPINETYVEVVTETFTIACECADLDCVETLDIDPLQYQEVRAEPRQFIVLSGHVYPDVETVLREVDAYVVVEKMGAAGETAESFDHPESGV